MRQETRKTFFAPAGLAFAAMILLVMGLPVWNYHSRPAKSYGATPAITQQDSAEQIAQDNELLRSVDMALSSNEESPIGEYYLSGGPGPHSKAGTSQGRNARPESRKQ
jgi:hypothetical protein